MIDLYLWYWLDDAGEFLVYCNAEDYLLFI